MKKIMTYLFFMGMMALFVGTAVFLYQKSNEKPITFVTTSAFFTMIVKKTVATGNIEPRRRESVG